MDLWFASFLCHPEFFIITCQSRGETNKCIVYIVWSNYSDLTRPHPKCWFSKGNPLISGKSRLVKYYNLARYSAYCMLKKRHMSCFFLANNNLGVAPSQDAIVTTRMTLHVLYGIPINFHLPRASILGGGPHPKLYTYIFIINTYIYNIVLSIYNIYSQP